jgi:hypothetical protein
LDLNDFEVFGVEQKAESTWTASCKQQTSKIISTHLAAKDLHGLNLFGRL